MKAATNYSNQRIGIFIDVQNLYHSAKNLYRGRVNYAELMKHLIGGRQLIRAMAYVVKSEGIVEPLHNTSGSHQITPPVSHKNAEPPSLGEGREHHLPSERGGLSSEGAFFEALENAGLELRLKDIQVWADGSKKADWDVGMAVDAIRMAEFLDVVILVTGDGDFIPLVDYLKWGRGRMVEVAGFRRSTSSKLQEAADKFINIEEIPKIILRR